MATRLKPIAHDDRLSLVEHLTELRTRIIICVAALLIAGGICLWQEDFVLDTVNKPLADVANKKPCDETRDPLEQADCWQQAQKKVNERDRARRRRRSPRRRRARSPSGSRREDLAAAAKAAAAITPSTAKKLPVTLGVGEPLTAT